MDTSVEDWQGSRYGPEALACRGEPQSSSPEASRDLNLEYKQGTNSKTHRLQKLKFSHGLKTRKDQFLYQRSCDTTPQKTAKITWGWSMSPTVYN